MSESVLNGPETFPNDPDNFLEKWFFWPKIHPEIDIFNFIQANVSYQRPPFVSTYVVSDTLKHVKKCFEWSRDLP